MHLAPTPTIVCALLALSPHAVSQNAYARSFERAWTASEAGELEQARAAYARCVELVPDSAVALYHAARVECADGRAEAAFGLLAQAAALDEDVRALAQWDEGLDALRAEPGWEALWGAPANARSSELVPLEGALARRPGARLLASSPDGLRELVRADEHLLLVDAPSGELLASRRQTDGWSEARFSPDGRHLLGVDAWDQLVIWDAHTLEETRSLGALLLDGFHELGFHPDGTRVLAAERDGARARWIDLESGRMLRTLEGLDVRQSWIGPRGERALAADGAMGGNKRAALYELESGRRLATYDKLPAHDLQGGFDASGELAFLAQGNVETVWLIDARSGALLHELRCPEGSFSAAALVGAPARLLTLDNNGAVRWWDPHSGAELERWELPFALNWRGRRVLRTLRLDAEHALVLDGELRPVALDLRARAVLWRGAPRADWRADWDRMRQGHELAWVRATQPLWVERTHPVPIASSDIAHTPPLLAVGTRAGTAFLVEPHGLRLRHHFELGAEAPSWVQLDSASQRLLASTNESAPRLYDAHSGVRIGAQAGAIDQLSDVRFGPRGERLLGIDEDGALVVCDARDGLEQLRVTPAEGAVRRARWSPDGRILVACVGEGALHLLSAEDGSALRAPIDAGFALNDFALNRAGTLLAAGGRTSQALVFDAESGLVVARCDHHDGFGAHDCVWQVQFAPDDKSLLTTAGHWWTVHRFDPGGQQVWSYEHGGGSPADHYAELSPDGERLLLRGAGGGVLSTDLGKPLTPRQGAWRTLELDPERILLEERIRLRCVELQSGEAHWGLEPFSDGSLLIRSRSGWISGSAAALANTWLVDGEALLRLDALAPQLVDPLRVRMESEGHLLAPPRAAQSPGSAPPRISLLGEAARFAHLPGAGGYRLQASAESAPGLGPPRFEVEVDGTLLEPDAFEVRSGFNESAELARLVLELDSPAAVRVRAVDARGRTSRDALFDLLPAAD